MPRYAAAAALWCAFTTPVMAAELSWDGHYRSRALYFDSLSMSDTNTYAEGASMSMDHRLRLQPGWKMSDNVALFTQLDLLPFTMWGDEPVQNIDPFTGEAEAIVLSDAVGPPTTEEGGSTNQNLQVTRLWGQVQTSWGQIRFGRVPVEWGTGMVFNAGNNADSEYGDTSDRLQVTGHVGDVYLLGAYETRYEGLIAAKDDYRGLAAAIIYSKEQAAIGTYHTYRWQRDEDSAFKTYIGDIWAEANMGPAKIEAEFAGVFGGGDIDSGANDLRMSAFGANLGVSIQQNKLRLGLGTGVATGDADEDDTTLHTFAFDPDFNVALMLFEEPMPTLEPVVSSEANGGRTTEAARTGHAIQNALFIRPTIGWQLRPDLTADLSIFAATKAKIDEDETTGKGYGTELDATFHYAPFPHFWLESTTGLLIPGKYLSEYEDEDYGDGFDRPAFGSRLFATVEF